MTSFFLASECWGSCNHFGHRLIISISSVLSDASKFSIVSFVVLFRIHKGKEEVDAVPKRS